ncbi:MAG: beta-L-arabinofuranosidase domain-containing protein, partial [Bryobacteraceae bacterium]
MQRATQAGGAQLSVLVEAGSLLWAGPGGWELRRDLERAAEVLIERSGEWKDAASLRRGLRALLTYSEVSGHRGALEEVRRVADRASRNGTVWWDRELGGAPIAAPACVLFRLTGERRRLTQGISAGMDGATVPPLLRTLWRGEKIGGRPQVAAEEILASLTGLVELYRLTGEGEYLKRAMAGWDELVREHRYVTGAIGWRGKLRGDGLLPGEPGAEVGWAGATAEWMRLNWELMRVTGESRYGEEIERTVFNHLLALQDRLTGAWAGHAPLNGRRRFE